MMRGQRRFFIAAGAAALLLAAVYLLRLVLSAEAGPRTPESPAAEAAEAPRPPGSPRPVTEGTRRMVERLKQIADNPSPATNVFLNEERVALFRSTPTPADVSERTKLEFMLANELLLAGRTEEAIEHFRDLASRLDAMPGAAQSPFVAEVHSLLAIAHMRLGEQRNCIMHHGTDSCLLPIRGNGVHTDQQGSRAAIQEYTKILTRNPRDLGARWLMNIAYMTVGEYPDKVPPQWLIPPRAFESDHDIQRFPDVAARAGVGIRGLSGAALMDDFDGDRHLDLILTSWDLRGPMSFFRNDRDGTFTDRAVEAGLTGIVGGLNAVHADYDNDGDLDVYVIRGAWLEENGLIPDSLLRNDGRGGFDDVTEEAGMLSFKPSQTAAWGDYDNDGWVDLFVSAESRPGAPEHPMELYHNNGDGTFTEVARAAGVAEIGFCKGAVWGDYDNDGRLDLYVTCLEPEPSNLLFHNDGPDGRGGWRFSEVGERAGVRGPRYSFPTWFFDYDNDGWLDIFVSGYAANTFAIGAESLGLETNAEKPRLYRNRRDGTFEDVTERVGLDTVLLTMGCNFGDLDNDGWLDFYAGTGNPDYRTLIPNRMFRNDGGTRFQDVTTSGGFGHLQKAHGVAFGDIDNDGDQEVFLKVGGAYSGDVFQSALFMNPGHGNHWIKLKLVGVETNRAAIGARIAVTIEAPGGARTIHRTVSTGSSFGGNPVRQEIGVGQARRIRRIEITWPTSGKKQVFEDVAVDQFLEIREGDPEPRPIELERLPLGS